MGDGYDDAMERMQYDMEEYEIEDARIHSWGPGPYSLLPVTAPRLEAKDIHEMKFWNGPGGAMLCDMEIDGVTQKLDDDSARFYGGPFMVCETMTNSAQRRIAGLLGGEWTGQSTTYRYYSIEERLAYGCRTCGECNGASHHWIEDPPEDPESDATDYACKHCEVRGTECPDCTGEGCPACDGEGVKVEAKTA